MPYATTVAQLALELSEVQGVGRVHQGLRHLRDEDRVRELFGVEEERDATGRVALRGWVVTRESVAEEHYSTLRNRVVERWRLRGIQSMTSGEGSERSFQEMLDRVLAKFRGLTTVAGLELLDAPSVGAIQHARLAGRLCHAADVELEAEELVSVSAVPGATRTLARASTRHGSTSAANQIAAELGAVSGSGRVVTERLLITTREQALDVLVDPVAVDPSALEGRRELRSWQVFRSGDAEVRGLGNRVEGSATWRLQGAWGWRDGNQSYAKFQDHIDAVRSRFRARPWLGSWPNSTQARAEPLQVREVGARMVADILTHFVDCELPVREVVHA